MILSLLFIVGCNTHAQISGSTVYDQLDTYTIKTEGEIPQASERGLDGKILMLESKYCSHCKTAIPILQEISEENDLDITILDVSVDEQRAEMEGYGLDIIYTPTLVIDGYAYIGARDKQGYEDILLK